MRACILSGRITFNNLFDHIIERRRKYFMAKKVVKVVKLQIAAGKANPAPPVGPAWTSRSKYSRILFSIQ